MQLFLLINLINLLFFRIDAVAEQLQCFKEGKIRYIKNNKKIMMNKAFCLNNIHKIISRSCIKKPSCQALKAYQRAKSVKPSYTRVGSPYYKKCSLLGGKPKQVEFYNGRAWRKTGICNFDDQSFISVFVAPY